MFLTIFIKSPSGNVECHGAECSVPEELGAVLSPLSTAGYEPSSFAEYEAQSVGAVNAQLEVANQKLQQISEIAKLEKSESVPAVE